jgi:hypothetical protein
MRAAIDCTDWASQLRDDPDAAKYEDDDFESLRRSDMRNIRRWNSLYPQWQLLKDKLESRLAEHGFTHKYGK